MWLFPKIIRNIINERQNLFDVIRHEKSNKNFNLNGNYGTNKSLKNLNFAITITISIHFIQTTSNTVSNYEKAVRQVYETFQSPQETVLCLLRWMHVRMNDFWGIPALNEQNLSIR